MAYPNATSVSPNKLSSAKSFYLILAVIGCWLSTILVSVAIYYAAPDTLHQDTFISITEIWPNVARIPLLMATASSSEPDEFVSEPYHDPAPFCDLPIDHDHARDNPNPKIVYTNEFPSSELSVEDIIRKREQPISTIPMCPNADVENYQRHQALLDKLPNNLVAYTNRCQINSIGRGKRQLGGLLSGDPLFNRLSTQIGFIHVYKAGGTSVRDTMNNILPGLGRTIWHAYKGHLREFMSDLFMFSFVRDPISRATSSFFELHRRNETAVSRNNMVGLDSFRFMTAMMQHRMDCAMANRNMSYKMQVETIGDIYFNMHIMPQMYFLTEHGNPWKWWPVNFVGNMTELTDTTKEILWEFYWNTTDYVKHKGVQNKMTYAEAMQEFDARYHHGRDRHNTAYMEGGERAGKVVGDEAQRYSVTPDMLSDDDVRAICDLYWMDYICIPFEMPAACNLTELILRHYGQDVVYKDCWDYDTQAWDTEWREMYLNGTVKKGLKNEDKLKMRLGLGGKGQNARRRKHKRKRFHRRPRQPNGGI